jgi:hypothetical protein
MGRALSRVYVIRSAVAVLSMTEAILLMTVRAKKLRKLVSIQSMSYPSCAHGKTND